jgi:hypothetical protein
MLGETIAYAFVIGSSLFGVGWGVANIFFVRQQIFIFFDESELNPSFLID